jgi:cysteine desulfurase/selenocysteine lyase
VTADRLVVCAGPWTAELVPQFAPLLTVVRIVNVHLGATTRSWSRRRALGVFSVEVPGVGCCTASRRSAAAR